MAEGKIARPLWWSWFIHNLFVFSPFWCCTDFIFFLCVCACVCVCVCVLNNRNLYKVVDFFLYFPARVFILILILIWFDFFFLFFPSCKLSFSYYFHYSLFSSGLIYLHPLPYAVCCSLKRMTVTSSFFLESWDWTKQNNTTFFLHKYIYYRSFRGFYFPPQLQELEVYVSIGSAELLQLRRFRLNSFS